jgi:hypothetical protein
MAKIKARARRLPLIYPDTVRPPPTLPGAESLIAMDIDLAEEELKVIRMAMAIHTASKQPRLTWMGWRHIAVALAIGSERAQKVSSGRMDTPDYRRVMGEFLRCTGFIFLNKDDRAAAVRLLPQWDDIDAWRTSLPPHRQQALNNPREVHAAWIEHRRKLGDPDAKPRPSQRGRRQFPSLLEQLEALAEQLQMAEERAERAERESTYFAEMMTAVAEQAGFDDGQVAAIRAKVRGAHEDDARGGEDSTEDD